MKLLFFGIALILIFWIIAWGKFTILSGYYFFLLWLGYILFINGVSKWLLGKSLLSKIGIANFVLLFIISVPVWWLFEFFNVFVKNWHYTLEGSVSGLEFFLRASVSFSIVVPAVFSTAFLFNEILKKIRPIKNRKFSPKPHNLFASAIWGFIFLIFIFNFPANSFPFIWLALFLIIDPINYALNFPSILNFLSKGNSTFVVSIALATLFAGFWWELWNYYSIPKWTYSVPYVGSYKIFEMPILGFLGYPVFGLELYSITNFLLGGLKNFFGISLDVI